VVYVDGVVSRERLSDTPERGRRPWLDFS